MRTKDEILKEYHSANQRAMVDAEDEELELEVKIDIRDQLSTIANALEIIADNQKK